TVEFVELHRRSQQVPEALKRQTRTERRGVAADANLFPDLDRQIVGACENLDIGLGLPDPRLQRFVCCFEHVMQAAVEPDVDTFADAGKNPEDPAGICDGQHNNQPEQRQLFFLFLTNSLCPNHGWTLAMNSAYPAGYRSRSRRVLIARVREIPIRGFIARQRPRLPGRGLLAYGKDDRLDVQ